MVWGYSRKVIKYAAACLVLSFTVTVPALAQSNTFDSQSQEYSHRYYKKQADRVYLSLIRKPELSPEQFILRLSAGAVFSGCPKLSNIGYQVNFNDATMVVDVGEYTVDMRKLPAAAHYACNVGGRTPTAEIPLSKQQLLDQGITQIEFRNGPYMDIYKLKISDQYVKLEPKNSGKSVAMHQAQKLPNIRDPLTHWLYPKKTVMLYAPGTDGDQAREAIETVAAHYKLAPLTHILPAFTNPLVKSDYSYYVDSGNNLPATLFAGRGQRIGSANIQRVVYDLQGYKDAAEPVEIYAKPPGAYE